MPKTPTRKGVVDGQAPDEPAGPAPSAKPDWESIEREFRAGVLSVREIAKRHPGVSHVAIHKRAKKEGWTRDLSAKVKAAVNTALVNASVNRSGNRDEQKRTEREIVEDAAAAVVSLVREHRADLSSLRELAASLTEQLRMAAGNRDALMALIDEAVAEMPDENPVQRAKAETARKAMMAAIALPGHIVALRDLSNVLKNLIPLERQAFNVDAGGPADEPDDPNQPAPSVTALEDFERRLVELKRVPAPAP